MTTQEVKLWARLRQLRPHGVHIRRQVPIGGAIVDFACLKARLVVEVDGEQHGWSARVRRDQERDAMLGESGFRVLRFWNREIDRGFDDVVETIYRVAVERMTPSVAPLGRHLPCEGKDGDTL